MKPFIVYALPRSRTAWLAKFLNYGPVSCGHELAIYMRSVEDVKAYFARPHTGAVETAAAQGWRILQHHIPDIRMAVIRRPVADVVESMLATDLRGAGVYDVPKLWANMRYGDRMLAEIAAQPGVMSLNFADLAIQEGCAAIFEHCLSFKFDIGWWQFFKDRNIQCDVPGTLAYYRANLAGVAAFKASMKRELCRLARAGLIASHKMEAA